MPTNQRSSDLEAYRRSLAEGFVLEDVNSTEDHLILTVSRGREHRMFCLDADGIEDLTDASGDPALPTS